MAHPASLCDPRRGGINSLGSGGCVDEGRPVDDNQAASPSAATKPGRGGLAKNSLNLPRLAFIGLAYFSLAPVIYLNMGFMETDSGGPVMPFLNGFIPVAGIVIDGYASPGRGSTRICRAAGTPRSARWARLRPG